MKKFSFLALGFLIAFIVGYKIEDDELLFGNNQDADQTITFRQGGGAADPKIKWDNSASQIKVANNGVTFIDIFQAASGSVSGIVSTLAQSFAGVKTFNDGWKLGTFTQTAVNRVETRTDAGPITADTTIFTFSSLTAGERYQVTLSAQLTAPDNAGTFAVIQINHNTDATNVASFGFTATDAQANKVLEGGVVGEIPSLLGTTITIKYLETDASSQAANVVATVREINDEDSVTF